MSFGHAWEMRRSCSAEAWAAARRAARLAFESLPERALWGPLESGLAPPWESGARPLAQSLGVWLALNSPPAKAGLDGALENDLAIEALPGADDWMAYPARVEREAKSGLVSTGAKLHDLVILAALCAIEGADPGALWVRHTDGDLAHWSAALSWLSRRPGCPALFIPQGAPGHKPGAALSFKETEELERALGAGLITTSLNEEERGSRRRGGRARKA